MIQTETITSGSKLDFVEELNQRLQIINCSGLRIIDVKFQSHFTDETIDGGYYAALIIFEEPDDEAD